MRDLCGNTALKRAPRRPFRSPRWFREPVPRPRSRRGLHCPDTLQSLAVALVCSRRCRRAGRRQRWGAPDHPRHHGRSRSVMPVAHASPCASSRTAGTRSWRPRREPGDLVVHTLLVTAYHLLREPPSEPAAYGDRGQHYPTSATASAPGGAPSATSTSLTHCLTFAFPANTSTLGWFRKRGSPC